VCFCFKIFKKQKKYDGGSSEEIRPYRSLLTFFNGLVVKKYSMSALVNTRQTMAKIKKKKKRKWEVGDFNRYF